MNFYKSVIICFLHITNVGLFYCFPYNMTQNQEYSLNRRRGNFKVGFHVPLNKRNELVIFDLDKTIWPFVSDECQHRIFQTGNSSSSPGDRLAPYPEALIVLRSLRDQGYFVGLISDCKDASKATRLLNLFSLPAFFDFSNIYPNNKAKAIQKMRRAVGIPYDNVLFFEYPSVVSSALRNLGITIIPVNEKGLTMDLLTKGLKIFSLRTRKKRPSY